MRGVKTLLLLWLSLFSLSGFGQQSNTGAVNFRYVVQNPKFYGDEARGWFEMFNLEDSAVQRRINDTLRKAFNEKIHVQPVSPIKPLLQLPDLNREGFTRYAFPLPGERQGVLEFNDKDSIQYFTQRQLPQGGGTHLMYFRPLIAPGKMAYIQIDTGRGLVGGGAIELTFSLVTGNVMPQANHVRLHPEKKKELYDQLYYMANQELQNNTTPEYRRCRITRDSRELNTDSVMISSQVLIYQLSGMYVDSPPGFIGKVYPLKCPPDVTFSASIYVSLPLAASVPFLDQKEWAALLESYKY